MTDEHRTRRVAYQIAKERLRQRPPPFGGPNAPLPHRMDVEAAMDEARERMATEDTPNE